MVSNISMSTESNMNEAVLACMDVCKSYRQGPQQVDVLKGINLSVARGERIAIIGASGSGKSTLLNVLGGLDLSDAGKVIINGNDLTNVSENLRGKIRNQQIGFVYQFHHLLPEFNAVENVAMPMLIAKQNKKVAFAEAEKLLAEVGLCQRFSHKPAELSGGERQRVAIARSLVNKPACVLMDEPTGNLDSDNAASIQNLMLSLSDEYATSFVVVTHDINIAKSMDSIYELKNGTLIQQ